MIKKDLDLHRSEDRVVPVEGTACTKAVKQA